MEQDYKEQLRMMTEGLGEWMDRREREQRRRRRWLRVALGVVVVAAAVLLQVFFPWRRETVKYIYVKDSIQVHDTIVSQPARSTPKPTTRKKPIGIDIGGQGVHISGSEDGEWGSIDIDENGVRIIGGDDEETGSIVIGAGGVRINGKDITNTWGGSHKKEAVRNMVKVSFLTDNYVKEMRMPKDKVQPFIDSIRACYKDVLVSENEDGSVAVMASNE